MKRNVLCINIESDYHSPPRPLNGRCGGTYGTAFWSPSHNAQVCRVDDEKWSAAIHRDILQMGIVPGNKWAIEDEFICEDGAIFNTLTAALRHEQTAPATSVIPSGIPVAREFVERASAIQLRDIASAVKMPGFRKLTTQEELRPALIEFLGYKIEPARAEAV